MSITNRITGPLYDERIKNILMGADHEYKRLANTSTSLLELLPPHYDLSSMFSYEQKGIVFRIKLIKPEIKISRHQLLFSTHFLEPEFLNAYKEHLSKALHKTIKLCVKKYSQKIKIKHAILDYLSSSPRNSSCYDLHKIVLQTGYYEEVRRIKKRIQDDRLLDKLTLDGPLTNISRYMREDHTKIIDHIESCTCKIVEKSRKNPYIFNSSIISGRKTNITGVLFFLSELISNLHINPTEINNISTAIILSIVYSVLQYLQSGRETEKDKDKDKDKASPALDFIPTIIAPHVFYLAKREKSSQYKYIEKEYLLGQLLTFLMYKTAYYAMHKTNVSHKLFYNDINNELPIDELKDNKLLSRNFIQSTDNLAVDVIEAGIKEISTLINQRKVLFFSFLPL